MRNIKKSNIYKYSIKNLELFGYHGVDNQEIKYGQKFYLDIVYTIKSYEHNFVAQSINNPECANIILRQHKTI